MKGDQDLKLFALLAFLAVSAQISLKVSEAAPRRQLEAWSNPTVLATEAQEPVLVADSAGDLHLFFVGNAEDDSMSQQTIYYMSRKGGQWTPSLDILVSSDGVVYINGAAVDAAGNLHLAWHDDSGAYHSRAHISLADNAGNWETHTVLPGRYPTGDMVLDHNGRLHMVLVVGFAEVVYLYSDDGGDAWSPTLPVYQVFNTKETAVGGAHIAVDQSGRLHVTWFLTAAEINWGSWSVWYGRSPDAGASWQVAELASPLFGESDIAVDADDNIHLVYGRGIAYSDGRWHRWSSDGGETWSAARLLYPGVDYASGLTGGFDFGLDSAGRLHMVNSYGRRDGEASAWHMVWQGTHWSEPEPLLGAEYHAHAPRLAITGGNQLEFVALAPRQASALVYRHGTTDSPALAAQPVATRVVASAAEDGTVAQAGTSEPAPAGSEIKLSEEARQAPPTSAPFSALLISVAAAAALILVAMLVLRRSPRRRR